MYVTVKEYFRTGSMLLGKVGIARAGSVLLWGIFQSGSILPCMGDISG